MNLGELLAYFDARRKFAGKQLSDPATLGQWGTQIGEDATQGSRNMLDASANMRSADPALRDSAFQKMLSGLLSVGPLSVHSFRDPTPPVYPVTETPMTLEMFAKFFKKKMPEPANQPVE